MTEITEIIFRKYFASLKMCGNTDDTFFDSINKVFIYLMTSACDTVSRHGPQGYLWSPRKLLNSNTAAPPVSDFYPTSQVEIPMQPGTYQRFLRTWKTYNPKVWSLLLSIIKSDIRARLAATQIAADQESDEPLNLGDTSCYEEELTWELQGPISAT